LTADFRDPYQVGALRGSSGETLFDAARHEEMTSRVSHREPSLAEFWRARPFLRGARKLRRTQVPGRGSKGYGMDDFLRSLHFENPIKHGVSPAQSVLTRWKSQLRIRRMKFYTSYMCILNVHAMCRRHWPNQMSSLSSSSILGRTGRPCS
jgi:hypothetical protein